MKVPQYEHVIVFTSISCFFWHARLCAAYPAPPKPSYSYTLQNTHRFRTFSVTCTGWTTTGENVPCSCFRLHTRSCAANPAPFALA